MPTSVILARDLTMIRLLAAGRMHVDFLSSESDIWGVRLLILDDLRC